MTNSKKAQKKTQKEINRENLETGIQFIRTHTLFGSLLYSIRYAGNSIGKGTCCKVDSDGCIYVNETETLSSKSWAYAIAHSMLHPAFGHFDAEKLPGYSIVRTDGTTGYKTDFIPGTWNLACDLYITRFLSDIRFCADSSVSLTDQLPPGLKDEVQIYWYLTEHPEHGIRNLYGTAAAGKMDMIGLEHPLTYDQTKHMCNRFSKAFACQLARSVSRAIHAAGGHSLPDNARCSAAAQASRWFIDHYPLLGGLAAHFKLIEDYQYCQKAEIQVAAIDVSRSELYINPSLNFSTEEWKFILAHEYLHAGLQHQSRCRGRNPYLWNVACDFVINGWLREMQIGVMPSDGLLYDEALHGLSAETIYDLILRDLRTYAKLDTFRGYGKGDMIGGPLPRSAASYTDLDEFCKNALRQGLEYEETHSRGFIPAGLVEEIRALSMPPIPWDVQLARWFQVYFAPLEKHRTYARPSRRQASTPDIPRPRYQLYDIPTDSRTFGVVIDTSGSMSSRQIGMALGSIASYAAANDVPFARVIFCDAAAYDAGYLSPEDIAGRVNVKGRGGTALQPGIDLLERASDFPKDGPILIITDGQIENKISIAHEHAWLLPNGGCGLPFRTRAPIFRFTE